MSSSSSQSGGPEPLKTELFSNEVDVHPEAWVAPGVILVGRVSLGARASVWYGSVLRGDLAPIRVGAETNIQDLTVVHVDVDAPAVIGNRVTVGHRAVIHGCTVEDDVLVGMGAVLLTGCRIGTGSLVAAGSVVREGFEVPPGAMVAGVPARVLGEVDATLRGKILEGVHRYLDTAEGYRSGGLGGGPWGGGTGGTR